MKLAVPKETADGETRVAIVAGDVSRLVKAGLDVVVEKDAGAASGCSDSEYERRGAKIEPDVTALYRDAKIIVKVQAPRMHPVAGTHEVDLMPEQSALIAHLGALGGLQDAPLLEMLNHRTITAMSLDCVPRITRAQSMDVLSSMSTITGYKSVLIATEHLTRMMPMLMTAAGTVPAARVFVLGAGVAGLQAIATAKRLGAIVEAFDTRPAVKEQVESLGGRFVQLDLGQQDAEDKGGYAKALSEDQHAKEQELLAKHVKMADVVITTALVPGRQAPELVSKEMVRSMKPGSVIVDLAAERGGNCALTEPGQTVRRHDVIICGPLYIPALLPVNASQMFSRNISTLLHELIKEGELTLDTADEIVAGILITRDGQTVHEPTKQALAKEKEGVS